jgi:hypothetical protein
VIFPLVVVLTSAVVAVVAVMFNNYLADKEQDE